MGVADRFESRVLGKVILDVGGEDLIDDHEADDEGHHDSEAEDKANGSLAVLVVLFGVDELLFGVGACVSFGKESVEFASDLFGIVARFDVEERNRRCARKTIREETHEGIDGNDDAPVVAEGSSLLKGADELKLEIVEFEVVEAFFVDRLGNIGIELAGLVVEERVIGLLEFVELGLDRLVDEDRFESIGRDTDRAELGGIVFIGISPEELADVDGIAAGHGGVVESLKDPSSRERLSFAHGEEVGGGEDDVGVKIAMGKDGGRKECTHEAKLHEDEDIGERHPADCSDETRAVVIELHPADGKTVENFCEESCDHGIVSGRLNHQGTKHQGGEEKREEGSPQRDTEVTEIRKKLLF